ncbi:probable beta-galactosidase 2 isoform X2 [Oscarella lobularis]|uniref:probable beta-galactosidase 2 isoform X2 n=1 Tax=Oscarella lobularis TaxID=121494 RepID=UPI0033136A0F
MHSFVLALCLLTFCYGYDVTYDSRSIAVNGSRVLLTSGAIHYPRSTPAMWPDLLAKAKANGLNTIQTYVFWNLHEPLQGEYDFSDRKNLSYFLQLAHDNGFYLTLRIGPFVQAECDFGGIPVWLNWIPDIEFRVYNQPWMAAMTQWMKYIVAYIEPYLAKNGGPIILTQIENEYHIGDMKYVAWCGQLADSLHTGTPWVMCNGASANNTINTCNSCDCSEYADSHSKMHPHQPLMWTELWQRHENWGNAQFERDPRDVAFVVANWIGKGGSHFNYYMWHGGNNYERFAAGGITQFYQDNAVLHSDGTTNEPKYTHLGTLHHLLGEHADILLHGSSSVVPVPFWNISSHQWEKGSEQVAYQYKLKGQSLSFLVNSAESPSVVSVLYEKKNFSLSNHSVIILDSSLMVLYNTNELPVIGSSQSYHKLHDEPLQWTAWHDTCNSSTCHLLKEIESTQPLEQIKITRDQTEYLWYRTNVTVDKTGEISLSIGTISSSLILVYLNGKMQGHFMDVSPAYGKRSASLTVDVLSKGTHLLEVLSVSLGIQAHVTNNQFAIKGITGGILLDKMNITESHWIHRPFLLGEELKIFDAAGVGSVTWEENTGELLSKLAHLCRQVLLHTHQKEPSLSTRVVSVKVTFTSTVMMYLLIGGNCTNQRCNVHYLEDACGKPTQSLYHVPPDWLHDTKENLLVICEVLGAYMLDHVSIVQKQ